MDSLIATSSQFISDMEEVEVVADRRLLARICLVREELRWIHLEASFNQIGRWTTCYSRSHLLQPDLMNPTAVLPSSGQISCRATSATCYSLAASSAAA